MRSPSSSTAPTVSATMPWLAPSSRTFIAAPALAEGEVLAGYHARRAELLGQQLRHKVLEHVVLASSEPNLNTSIASAPAWSNIRCRWSSVVRRNGGVSGLKWAPGEGSKVATITGRRSCAPRCTARPTTASVAEVEAVEIAQRDDRAAKLLRDRLVVEQALHQGSELAGLSFKSRRLTRCVRIPKWPSSRFTGHGGASRARRFSVGTG